MREIPHGEWFAGDWNSSFWFAGYPDEKDGPGVADMWQAWLQTPGMCHPLADLWFSSKKDCEDFIRQYLANPSISTS